ncbi:hypothetical protein A2969_02435 [Candidatus Woesebacteria bacterium RIFCSPLOWO2_01_FULL_42_67]|nr:MAG: hypothetical protein A2804_02525 [Candidatus Pacebacteria bacterium RIFCSPHIGHO2_01_FULL_46_10]OGM66466.1 MAG: hypothetical protein A2969_02435 [Candidatus Woesebacteria bacterium RIFCSPLOWO2_01_FULL_42_67]
MEIFHKKNISLPLLGFLQGLGVAAYCSLVGFFMIHANTWFPIPQVFFGPAPFLMLFVVSALITALIVFYKPYLLFFEKKQKTQALQLVVYTTAWIAIFLFLFLIGVAILR